LSITESLDLFHTTLSLDFHEVKLEAQSIIKIFGCNHFTNLTQSEFGDQTNVNIGLLAGLQEF